MPADQADQTWTSEILAVIRSHWANDQIFALADVYALAEPLTRKHPENHNVEAKIRQVLQQLRDLGEITFIDNEGRYAPNRREILPGDALLAVSDLRVRSQLARIREMIGQVVTSSDLAKIVQGFGSQKGIYKPSGSKYALWVRETRAGPYSDKDLRYRPDGSWTYRYSPEGREGKPDLSLDTNTSLMRCKDHHIPVGVFRQSRDRDGRTAYEVLGLATVAAFDGEHFVLDGEPIDVEDSPLVTQIAPTFQPFEPSHKPLGLVARLVRDQRFGTAVRKLYHERCSLCNIGFRVGGQAVGLDAAHIIPVKDGGVTGDLRNGILLCKNHHALFDQYAWTMDEGLSVRLAPDRELRTSALDNHLTRLEGHRLPNLPGAEENYPASAAIKWRVERFDEEWD